MAYTYKQLTAEDVPTLKQLLRVLAEAFEDMDAYQSAVPRDEYLGSLLIARNCRRGYNLTINSLAARARTVRTKIRRNQISSSGA